MLPAPDAAPAAIRPFASGAGTRPASWSRGASPGMAHHWGLAAGTWGGRTPGTSWGCRMDLVQGEVEAQGEEVGVQ